MPQHYTGDLWFQTVTVTFSTVLTITVSNFQSLRTVFVMKWLDTHGKYSQ